MSTAAERVVERHATSPDDRAELMAMLGLVEPEKLAKARRTLAGARTRARILVAARAQVDRGEPVCLRGVARDLGITAPAVYRHYTDAAALADEVAVGVLADVLGEMGKAQTRSGVWAVYRYLMEQQPRRHAVLMGSQRARVELLAFLDTALIGSAA